MGSKKEQLIHYRKTLTGLRDYLDELRITVPHGAVTIVPGTEGPGRPLGAKLPVFPQDETGTDEAGMKRVLFNLASLLGFKPPSPNSGGRSL